jgi:ribonuclease HI
MAKKKYYVVWKGLKTGVFLKWEECKKQVKGFSGAIYKSFNNKELAEQAFKNPPPVKAEQKTKPVKNKPNLNKTEKRPVLNSLSVDASCMGNPGIMEYQGVYTKTGKKIFLQGPFCDGTNNIGEFLAIVHGLSYLKKKNSKLSVYSDSKVAIGWVKNKKAKTKLKETSKNKNIFDLIIRAEKWLRENSYENTIVKWDTKIWGEIPADFGRK